LLTVVNLRRIANPPAGSTHNPAGGLLEELAKKRPWPKNPTGKSDVPLVGEANIVTQAMPKSIVHCLRALPKHTSLPPPAATEISFTPTAA